MMVPDMGDISAGHSPIAIPTAKEAAVSESHLVLLMQPPQQLMLPSGQWTPHHHSCCHTNCHSCIPSHTCHFSCRHHSCHSTDQNQSCSSNDHCTAQEKQPRKATLHPRPSTPHKPDNSKTFTIQDSPSDSDSDSDPLNY